jgi:Holliday junction DNA helicase RuvA
MISHITGKIIYEDLGSVVIETAGIGYKVYISNDTLSEITKFQNKPVSLWTYQVIREDISDLYGFLNKEELDFFELLISISGIGPKTGLSVLNASSIENLKTAIATGETSYLTKISGIGKKLAEKIVFELKEKIGFGIDKKSESMKGDTDVLEALVSLGYGERDVREAIKKLPREIVGTSNRVKNALQILGKN